MHFLDYPVPLSPVDTYVQNHALFVFPAGGQNCASVRLQISLQGAIPSIYTVLFFRIEAGIDQLRITTGKTTVHEARTY